MSVLIDRRFLYVLLLATAAPAFAQQTTWNDPSPHRVELIAVDGGVQLEVLDWGGSGPALVLLAGPVRNRFRSLRRVAFAPHASMARPRSDGSMLSLACLVSYTLERRWVQPEDPGPLRHDLRRPHVVSP